MAQYIYTMVKVRKAHGSKVILDDVTLAFLPGAKIGVVGPNGTGKSSLFKIMAGLDQPSNGEARLAEDATVGILLQEPPLTEGKTVLDNVEEAVHDVMSKLYRYHAISEELADPDADYDKLLAEMGDLQTDLDHANAWDLGFVDQALWCTARGGGFLHSDMAQGGSYLGEHFAPALAVGAVVYRVNDSIRGLFTPSSGSTHRNRRGPLTRRPAGPGSTT